MPKYFFKMYYRGLRIYFASLVLMRLRRCSFISLAVFCPWHPASNLLTYLCYASSDVNFTKQR